MNLTEEDSLYNTISALSTQHSALKTMNDLYQQIAALSPEQRILFEQRLKQRGIKLEPAISRDIPKREILQDIPLSFAQQRLWFIQQLDPNSVVYNVPSALRLQGQLNITVLQHTLNQLVARHETLRTRFTLNANKQPIQVIDPPLPVALPIVDLSRLADAQVDKIVSTLARTEAEQPFDWSHPLLRVKLLWVREYHHVLLITVHHIISDRWSIGIFLREMTAFYNAFVQGEAPSLTALPIQYADWTIWQRQILQGEKLEAQVTYWKQQLRDLSLLNLPIDRRRPAVPSYQGDQYPVAFSKPLSDALKSLSARSGTTLFSLILAAFQTLLCRHTQQSDIVVGTDIANRDRSEITGLIGLLVNTLVLRTDLSGDPTFRELLERVRLVMVGALAHQDLPLRS